jgi:hypothetical protein
MHQFDAAWPLQVDPRRQFVVCDVRGAVWKGLAHYMGGDVTGIDIHNPDPKLFPEVISKIYLLSSPKPTSWIRNIYDDQTAGGP